jgi:hypothetical protein
VKDKMEVKEGRYIVILMEEKTIIYFNVDEEKTCTKVKLELDYRKI